VSESEKERERERERGREREKERDAHTEREAEQLLEGGTKHSSHTSHANLPVGVMDRAST
jgi:hypothetical protein